MLASDSEAIECREASRPAARFHIEFCADAHNEFCPASFRGKHAGKKKQIARLHRLRIYAERLRRRRQVDAKFAQPLLRTGGSRLCVIYHRPTCAPPSTCSTSPVTCFASVR